MKRALFRTLLLCVLLPACRSSQNETPPPQQAETRQQIASDPVPEQETTAAGAPDAAAAPDLTTAPVGNLPFVGRRTFETRPAVTGTGTPHRYVDILENGDVYFGYGQQDIAAGTAGERFYAGKYGRVLKCAFASLEDTRYYIVGPMAIVEVDASGHKLVSEDCCTNDKVDQVTQCPCEGELFEAAPAP